MDNSEKLTLDAKQRHLAKLKKKLAKHERKLERSLRVSQAKEHVRKKLKEQALIEAAENQSLMKENLSFDSGDDQSFNHSCLSPFVSKDSDVTVVDLSTGDITLSDINQGDRTLSNATSGTATPQKSKESTSCMKDGSTKRKIKSKDEVRKSRNSSPRIVNPIPTSSIVLQEFQEKLKDPFLAKETLIHRQFSPLAVKTPLTASAAHRSKDRRLNDSDKIIHKTSSKKCDRDEPKTSTPLALTPRSKDRQLKDSLVIENEGITDRTLSRKQDGRRHSEEHRASTPLTPTSISKDRQLRETPVIENERITDRTLSRKQDGGRRSEEYRTSFNNESRSVKVDKISPRIERSVLAMAVRQDSPKLNMKVLDETTNQRQRKECSDVPTISKKMQSPSNRAHFLNAKNVSFSNELPSPINAKTSKHQTLSTSNQTNQKPSPTNQKSSYMASTNEKPSPGNHKTPTNQKPTIPRTLETSPKQKPPSIHNQTPSASNQKTSPSNQKTSPSNQKSCLDDSGISQSSLEISRTSFLIDSLSLTPTFGDDGCEESRRKVDKPQSENKIQDPKQTLQFQASEIDFSGLESCDIKVRVQNKNSAKSFHEVSNFDTIEFISQTKSAQKPNINVPDDQPLVNLQQQTSKTKLKKVEEFESVTENSFNSRSKRKSESLAMPDLKSAPTKHFDSNSEEISENWVQRDEDVQILSQGDLNFGIMEGMDPDLPILIIDRKSKRRSRSRHKSNRQTSSPIISQKEVARSIKISTSRAKPKPGVDTRNRSSRIDSLEAPFGKLREMELYGDSIQADTIDLALMEHKRTERQIDKKVQYVEGDITDVSESDSQRSVSILVDTSKSLSSSCMLDEKISFIESGDDNLTLTIVSPKTDEHFSQSLLKSSKKLSPKNCIGENDCKTKSPRNSTACENINENSCSIVTPLCNPGTSSSQEKHSSQSSHLSDSLALKRRKFKHRKRSLSHGKDGSESLGSSQDSKRIKVSETSQDSSSMNSAEESMNYKSSSKSLRKGNKAEASQESIKCKTFEKSSNNTTSENPETSTATKNVTLDSEQNIEMSQYSEFTELDVVEFSQFKFSEEFLTEGSENSERGRKRKRHPSHLGMIVQRRSPRVASLVDSESSSNSCSDNSRHRMSRREKCLIISSVFQYLVDEIKRESDIEEFKLPDSQFKDLVDVKILENEFELDDNIAMISAAKTALCAERQKSPKYNSTDSLNLENRDITSRETCAIVTCDKCNFSKGDKCDNGPCNECDIHNSVKNYKNENSVNDFLSSKICLNSKECKDTNSHKKISEIRIQIQNSPKLQNHSQSSASALNISMVDKSKQRAKVNSVSDIDIIYDSEPIDEDFVDSNEESTTTKARYKNLTTDFENDIKVIYDSEPIPDDSMSEEKCYHRNDATDLQENDLSTISEKSMKDNSAISDNFEGKKNEDFVKRSKSNEQESFNVKNVKSAGKGDKSESTKILKSSAFRPEQVETLDENLDDSEVTFKNNIQLLISTPKFSAKVKRGQSKNLFRNSTSTPKCANLTQTPKTPNVDEVKSSTPKINSKFINSVSNVESFETPKAELSKFAENLDAYTTPKDANIRRHFNFADDNLSPPLFPTQKDLTPIGTRRLDDETLDSFIQIDDDETECNDLIGPTDCIKLCREESVVFISGGTWTSDGLEYSYIVCLLPSAISVWSQCQGQWDNELDWYLSQTYQAIEGWVIKKPNKVVLVILEEDKTGEQRVSLFYYDLLSGDSNMAVIDLHITQTNPVTSLLCCIVNEDQLIIGYNHCTSLSATKHILIDGYKQMSLCCHLESTSGYLMDIVEVRHLECCVVGLTSKREALIWNHEAGFLIKKINLESVITPGVSLTAANNIQGYLVCHLLYRVKSDSPGYVVIVNISNNSSLILHDYPSLQFSWKGLKNAAISGDSLLASDIQGNTGLWDMVSGELLADIPRSKVSSGNINQSEQTLYVGLDGGAVHVYPMENIDLKN